MTIIETRHLHWDDLRRLCIAKEWCTNATNEEYQSLADYVNAQYAIVTNTIYYIAKIIKDHSETEQTIEGICFEIARVCHSFFEIED